MQLAKAVANAAAALVLKAKTVAQRTEDSGLQTQVIAAATQCALSTSQLVACTKVSPRGRCSPCRRPVLPPTHEPLVLSLWFPWSHYPTQWQAPHLMTPFPCLHF